MNRNFMKLAFVSALAFAATQGVNAQMTAPGWAQEQNNATVQTLAEGLQDGQNFVVSETDRVIVYNVIEKNTINSESEYFVSVVGITKSAYDKGVTEVEIPFSVMNGTVTAKVVRIETFDVIDDAADPAKLETKVTGVSLAGITKLTVGISGTADHLYPFENTTTITKIDDGAFANLTGLTDIITYCEAAPTMKSNAFASSRYSKAKLTVPNIKGKKEYQGKAGGVFANAEGWNNFMYNNKLYVNGSAKFFGDFDNSGSLNSTDVKRMISYLNAIEDDEEYSGSVNALSLDINGDGSFTSTDVKRLLSIINTIEDM